MKREFVSCFTTIHSPKRLNLRRNFDYLLYFGKGLQTVKVSREIVASRDDLRDAPGKAVAQVSKPAVSPTSKSAGRWSLDGLRIWKSATQQTCKSALLWLRQCRALYRRIAFCGKPVNASALEISGAPPITNRRYGRLQICATLTT